MHRSNFSFLNGWESGFSRNLLESNFTGGGMVLDVFFSEFFVTPPPPTHTHTHTPGMRSEVRGGGGMDWVCFWIDFDLHFFEHFSSIPLNPLCSRDYKRVRVPVC